MKILLIQLARLGDIYMTWPAIRALRRQYPEAQIDVLTRPRFAAAFEGLKEINNRILLPTQHLMAPLIDPQVDIKQAYQNMSQFVDGLEAVKYDWIVNYSFSPFSSYLAHAISHEGSKVSGYTRHADGFLSIPDDISAYFYAQVGIGRANRFHLAEIFATQVEVDLQPQDWAAPQIQSQFAEQADVLVHVGASEEHKRISASKWTAIINQFLKLGSQSVGLIGASAENALAEAIMAGVPQSRVKNFVGRTQIVDLFSLIQKAQLVIGGDSAPMHMASLTGTACFNISFPTVNFWETGPRAAGSYVYRCRTEDDLASDTVAQMMARMIAGEKLDLSAFPVTVGTPSYQALTTSASDFQWNFIESIYLSKDFPIGDSKEFIEGILKLADINSLMIEQMEAVQKGADLAKISGILDRGEEIIETIGKLVPTLAILVRWYQTEKVRIPPENGPADQGSVLARNIEIQKKLGQVLQLYVDYQNQNQAVQEKL